MVLFFCLNQSHDFVEPDLLHVKPALLKLGKSYGFIKSCVMAQIRSESYF